ncbi:MAG: energy-coupling factor transporter transmembrane protein EcfT [Firmicutes bacterium]|nr:energy-coupling factor transporter transmembrane protein EcfT [Bacillota bacterium]
MSRSITLGHYLPGDTVIHRMNPRIKVLVLIIILSMLFAFKSIPGLLTMLLAVLLLFAVARVPFRYLLKGLRPILYIALFALIIFLFFTKGGVVLFRLGSFTVESDGLEEGLFVIIRLVTLVLFSLLLTLTTTPLSLTYGLGYYLKPLGRIGLPAEEVVMIMAISLRFIPTLLEESQRLMRAQVSRGADFESGSILSKAKNLGTLIVPLFVSAFRRADELALAMEARGYRLGAKRTRLQEDLIKMQDWLVLLTTILLLVVVLYMNI